MKNLDDRPERAQRLVQARLARGFKTAKAAAERFGWKNATYNQHETGRTGYQNWLSDYAKAFKVDESWLWSNVGRGPGGTPDLSIPEHTKEKLRLLEPDDLMDVFDYLDGIVDRAVQRSRK
ncbi:helix-turn-helix transcriptional regulator [Mesorhizobium sp. M1B.F.Ca.ET.045.04.1.1]|uniref:helix-turn-helix domain-containing protein n=1 Tax=Mesorhizobium sp. M1B.F.Ca.ET.045.04.1.1 TaxID=2493673 RepID=UPI000F7563D6|nr:helix-turn-helix transcriptional regulator [Mesorhizobium sp. M1B.F.Ca.ET.045.04.1.1]AZO29324.1 XRE family transcriptional regulator [Mesorhizobium sp. M1B.F.Ca.ET.045.04.1.1]